MHTHTHWDTLEKVWREDGWILIVGSSSRSPPPPLTDLSEVTYLKDLRFSIQTSIVTSTELMTLWRYLPHERYLLCKAQRCWFDTQGSNCTFQQFWFGQAVAPVETLCFSPSFKMFQVFICIDFFQWGISFSFLWFQVRWCDQILRGEFVLWPRSTSALREIKKIYSCWSHCCMLLLAKVIERCWSHSRS